MTGVVEALIAKILHARNRSLENLVTRRYLRAIPPDPLTRSAATWAVVPPTDPKKGAVFDVRSGAKGAGLDGTPYAQW